MQSIELMALVCLAFISDFALARPNSDRMNWVGFKNEYGKDYQTAEENEQRMALFLATKERIEQHNSNEQSSYKLGLNYMADWTPEELAGINGSYFDSIGHERIRKLELSHDDDPFLQAILAEPAPVPVRVDWRSVPNRVSEVKAQRKCQGSWAFAATGVLEGQQMERNLLMEPVSLSEQQIIDCTMHADGCTGGRTDIALKTIEGLGGIAGELDYPFLGPKDFCWYNPNKFIMKVRGVKTFVGEEDKLEKLVAKFGPVAVTISREADALYYKSGIYTCSKKQSSWNDWILVVGYGSDRKFGDYWILKGSWGREWGENGYMRIRRGVCQIGAYVTIPLV
uniref:Cathepsin L n=1 Tax=Aceria tosichella TaxID=561515 RepID=A0A6G1S9W2_9ACAR